VEIELTSGLISADGKYLEASGLFRGSASLAGCSCMIFFALYSCDGRNM